MNTPPAPHAVPPVYSRSLFGFIGSELRGLLGAFWRPFWKTATAVTLLLLVLLAVLLLRVDPPQRRDAPEVPPPSILLQLLLAAGFSLFYAIPVGVAAGLLGMGRRLFGRGILVPLFLIPLAVFLSIWLCSGWLADRGRAVLDTIVQTADAKGFPETKQALNGVGKAAHGGIEVLAVLAILLIPFLLVDAFGVLFDPSVLWQLTQFALALLLATCLGLIPATLASLVALSFGLVRRLRERYTLFLQGR